MGIFARKLNIDIECTFFLLRLKNTELLPILKELRRYLGNIHRAQHVPLTKMLMEGEIRHLPQLLSYLKMWFNKECNSHG